MERLRELFERREDPYAGLDVANAARFGAALWFLGAALTTLMLPFVPPDEGMGDAGWAVAAGLVVAAVVFGIRMRAAGGNLRVDPMLGYSYAALVAIAAMVWLSGGENSPYAHMYLLAATYTCAIHPPRRAVTYLACVVVVALGPLVYADFGQNDAIDLGFQVFVWTMVALLILILMRIVRAQRLGLRIEGDRARQQARVDQLTGLSNRRAFDEALASAVELAQTSDTALCLLVGDIDDFKDFNDRFGHLEGDRVLRCVGEALRGALRRPDAAYRWGGDEFAVILPGADESGAELVAERIDAAVRRNVGPDGEPITMATGVAELDRTERRPAEALLRAADESLIRAKGSGSFEIPHVRR